MASDFADWVRDRQRAIEDRLARWLPGADIVPQRLHEAMRYAVLGAGKRVRPLAAFAAGELTGAPGACVERAAAAVELIHAYSLVHDDLPAMDNDTLRRGRPTCHVVYGEATALLVGDALQALAFQWLSDAAAGTDASTQLQMVRELAIAAGSRGMAGGQAIDLASVDQTLSLPELEVMHIHKTGALIRASLMLGAACGAPLAAEARASLERFSGAIGLAFQVIDDVLDAESSTATLGKTAGKDAMQHKPTYVALLGAERARALGQELYSDALRAIESFGPEALRLRELAHFIVFRSF
ncbi:MAG: polyprenyl synthetase family protein [Betaproteobacteria bacterium]|nr:polyprenyl synthetase family protein [Betaproteobacteria bacterium]